MWAKNEIKNLYEDKEGRQRGEKEGTFSHLYQRIMPQIQKGNMKILLYTAITGGYELSRSDIRVFTDEIMQDMKKSSLFYKALTPYFEEYAYSIWMDGNTELKVDPEYLIEKYLKDADIACLRHPERNSIYTEAEVCKKLKLDYDEVIDEQMQRYRDENYPGEGLSCTTYILRRHTKKVDEFNRLWWSEICKGSRRDQLSFDYALWKLGIRPKWFDVYHFDSHKVNPYFNYKNHHNEVSRIKTRP